MENKYETAGMWTDDLFDRALKHCGTLSLNCAGCPSPQQKAPSCDLIIIKNRMVERGELPSGPPGHFKASDKYKWKETCREELMDPLYVDLLKAKELINEETNTLDT